MTLSRKDRQGITLIAITLSLTVIVFAAGQWLKGGPKPGSDGCYNRVTRNTIILLDRSDSIPVQTRREILARAMEWIADSVSEGERVSVYSADSSSAASLVPVFDGCRPPADGNAVIEDAARVRRTFDSSFVAPLRSVLNSPDGSSNRSPIAQALTDLSLSAPMRSDTVALLVFSDLIEHDPPRFSLYSCRDRTDVVRAFRRGRAGMLERPQFHNLRAMLHIIPRAGMTPALTNCRDALWVWFFGDNVGDRARLDVQYLPGGVTP